MSKFFLDLSNQEWYARTFQVTILAADIYFFLNGKANVFFGLSAIIIISLFSLQVVSRRFQWLFPIRKVSDFNVKTPALDTYILRIFLILSIDLLVIGFIVRECQLEVPLLFKIVVALKLLKLAGFLLLILPIIWMGCGKKIVKPCIIKKIKQHYPVKIRKVCPLSGDDDKHYRTITKELVSDDSGDLVKIEVKCSCDVHTREVPFQISY